MNVLYVSAEPGQPSVFWQSETGKFYRTKKQAIEDNADNSVNPDDYEVKTSWWKRNKKTVKISFCVSLMLILAVIIYKNKIKK